MPRFVRWASDHWHSHGGGRILLPSWPLSLPICLAYGGLSHTGFPGRHAAHPLRNPRCGAHGNRERMVKMSKIVWPLVAPSATVVFTLLFVGRVQLVRTALHHGRRRWFAACATDVLGFISTEQPSAACQLRLRTSARQCTCGADLPVHCRGVQHHHHQAAQAGDPAVRKSVDSSTLRTFGWDGLIQILLIGNSIVMLAPIIIMVFSAFKNQCTDLPVAFSIPTSPM